MLKRIRLHLVSTNRDLAASQGTPPAPERTEFTSDAKWRDDGKRVEISYRESELTGVEGCTTILCFTHAEPHVVSLTRHGTVRADLLFAAGRHHTTAYGTPYGAIDVRIHTARVENRLADGLGSLTLDYTVEFSGTPLIQTQILITLQPYFEKPAVTV